MRRMTVAAAGSRDGDRTSSHVEGPWTRAWRRGHLQSALVTVIVTGEFLGSAIIC